VGPVGPVAPVAPVTPAPPRSICTQIAAPFVLSWQIQELSVVVFVQIELMQKLGSESMSSVTAGSAAAYQRQTHCAPAIDATSHTTMHSVAILMT
jgi:hypothetical protein